jgi:hypothetical protein
MSICIYQFPIVQTIETNNCFVHLSCELFLSSLGIRRVYHHHYRLDRELLTPTIFIVFIVVYIHFFRRQTKSNESRSLSMIVHQHASLLCLVKLIKYWQILLNRIHSYIICCLVLHAYRIVLTIVCICLTRQANLCPMNFILVLIFVLSLLFSFLQTFALSVYIIVSSLHILMLMIVRLELFASLGQVKHVCLPLSLCMY